MSHCLKTGWHRFQHLCWGGFCPVRFFDENLCIFMIFHARSESTIKSVVTWKIWIAFFLSFYSSLWDWKNIWKFFLSKSKNKLRKIMYYSSWVQKTSFRDFRNSKMKYIAAQSELRQKHSLAEHTLRCNIFNFRQFNNQTIYQQHSHSIQIESVDTMDLDHIKSVSNDSLCEKFLSSKTRWSNI